MIALIGEGEDPEETVVDEVEEIKEELDELDATSKVVEEGKVNELIVEFWQTTSAAIPTMVGKIGALILLVTTSQREVRMSERSGDRMRNCLGEQISMRGIAVVISRFKGAHRGINNMPFGIAELQLDSPPA